MRTQSIGIQSSKFDSTGSKNKVKGSSEFDFLMGMSMIQKDMELSVKATKVSDNNVQSIKSKPDTLKGEAYQETKVHNPLGADNSEVTEVEYQDGKETPVLEPKNEIDIEEEETLEKLSGVMESIMAMLQGLLDISKEELEQIMLAQGINPEDLANPEMLQQLLLTVHGETDISAFLIDENLNSQMQEILQNVDQILAESDLNLSKEEIQEFLHGLNQEVTVTEEVVEVGDDMANLKADTKEITLHNTLNGNQPVADVDGTAAVNVNVSEGDVDQKQNEIFETIVDNIVQQSTTMEVDGNGNLVEVTQLRNIVNQIVEQIKIVIKPDLTTMSMQLNPENLGKVQVSVQSQNGVMTAQFVVQNELVKEAIESQVYLLKENLITQGLKVENIEITVSTAAFEQKERNENSNQPNQSEGTRQLTLEEAFHMEEYMEGVKEPEDNHMVGPVGGQIDYNA